MPGFTIDPERLNRAADRLRDQADTFAGQPSLKFSAQAKEAGAPEVVAALEAFQQVSAVSNALLTEDARRLSARMREASRVYVRFDHTAAETLVARAQDPIPALASPDTTGVISTVLG
ncbi:MAG: hypothetical protein QOI21_3288 [Actinomycetota bacterium]|jgi:hypothetical protein|nr:hypothetical protein [Actinomycetota bacterium]